MPPKKKTEPAVNPADSAIAEVTEQPIVVKFRGEDFTIPQKAFRSVPVNMAIASGRSNDLVYALLKSDEQAARRFVALCTDDDEMGSVAKEFVDAVNEAGQGNS